VGSDEGQTLKFSQLVLDKRQNGCIIKVHVTDKTPTGGNHDNFDNGDKSVYN